MPKIERKLQKIFGGNVPAAGNIARFGSLAAQNPQDAADAAGNTDPDLIQSLPDGADSQKGFDMGWRGATVRNNVAALQDMNALQYLFSYQLAYIFQSGVPEWLATQEYYLNSLCSRNGVIYISTHVSTSVPPDPNIGNDPATSANFWRPYASITTGAARPNTTGLPKGHLHYDSNIPRWITWDGSKWTTIEGAPGDIKYVSADSLATALLRNPGWELFGTATGRVLAGAEDVAGRKNGDRAGQESVTAAQLPAHSHNFKDAYYVENRNSLTLATNKLTNPDPYQYGSHSTDRDNDMLLYRDTTTDPTGSGQSMSIMQPTLYAWCLIKT